MPINVTLQRLPHGAGLPAPHQQTALAAGFDLPAATELTLAPMAYELVPTGFAIALPAGYEAQVRPRSGLARNHGITLLNSPGTIDADYRGEIKVLVINLGSEPYTISRGDRIAQLVCAPVAQLTMQVQDEPLPPTARGESGFGSTGR